MKYIFVFLLITLPIISYSQLDKEIDASWELAEEETNIKVFTRVSETSPLKELRILLEMKGDIDTLIHIINDASNFKDWVYKCSDSSPLAAPDGYQSAYTATTDFPFPLSDRELVAISKQWWEEDGTFVSHGFSAFEYTPKEKHLVRIGHYESRWEIMSYDDDSIFIDYKSSVDPGGNIPSWIVNLAITAGPLKTFDKLTKLVEKRSYITPQLSLE